jgi:hypothetical protein
VDTVLIASGVRFGMVAHEDGLAHRDVVGDLPNGIEGGR